MKKIKQLLATVFLMISGGFSLTLFAQNIYSYSPNWAAFNQQLSELKQEINPGFSLLVIHGDSIIKTYNSGITSLDEGMRIDEHTAFNIASISKTFTAAAILKLKEEGKLKLSDKIAGYFPTLPDYTANIQVYHLLTHTSGLPDYERAEGEHLDENSTFIEKLANYSSLEFEPLTNYSYCNRAYVILAELVEKISGTTYSAYLRQHFFDPLNMTDTYVVEEIERHNKAARAIGYRFNENTNEFVQDDSGLDKTFGSTGIYSSTADLYKWYIALKKNLVINSRSKELMFNYPVTTSGQFSYIGMGWFNETLGRHNPELIGLRKRGAIGVSFGFRGMLEMYEDNDFGYICLSNSGEFPPVVGGKLAGFFFK